MLKQLSALQGSWNAARSWLQGGHGVNPPHHAPAESGPPSVLDHCVRCAPSPQTALDIFKDEWTSRLPGPLAACSAGKLPLFEDDRITWAASQFGGFQGKTVLEIGPLEGGHSYLLEKLGAAQIIAVESNSRAYLKCLVIKELLGLQRARFLCGDATEFLKTTTERFDAVIASGVLYHLRNPVELLALLADRTDHAFLWTHYYDHAIMARMPHLTRRFSGSRPAIHEGFAHTLYRYDYLEALQMKTYSGGNADYSHWMSRSDILDCLGWAGFDDVRLHAENTTYHAGPYFGLAALRRPRQRD